MDCVFGQRGVRVYSRAELVIETLVSPQFRTIKEHLRQLPISREQIAALTSERGEPNWKALIEMAFSLLADDEGVVFCWGDEDGENITYAFDGEADCETERLSDVAWQYLRGWPLIGLYAGSSDDPVLRDKFRGYLARKSSWALLAAE